jgi:hypothetical protein
MARASREDIRTHWLCKIDGPNERPTAFLFSSPKCQRFEVALFSGAIERVLNEECQALFRKLKQCKERMKEQLDKQITDHLAATLTT